MSGTDETKEEKRYPVKVVPAGVFDLALLHTDFRKFHIPFDEGIFSSKFGKVYVAIDKKNPMLILGYLTVAFAGNKAKIMRMSTRINYEKGQVGRQLYWKARSHMRRIGIKRIEVPNPINDAQEFYLKKLRMNKERGVIGEDIKAPNSTKRKIAPPKGLAPQNLMNPLKIRRRK